MSKPDRLGITFGPKVALRVTNDWQVLLNPRLTKAEMRDVITVLTNGLAGIHSTVLEALTYATGDAEPNGACMCPRCRLVRLRKMLDEPVLH